MQTIDTENSIKKIKKNTNISKYKKLYCYLIISVVILKITDSLIQVGQGSGFLLLDAPRFET